MFWGLLWLSACSWSKEKPHPEGTIKRIQAQAPAPGAKGQVPSAKTPSAPTKAQVSAAAMIIDAPAKLRAFEEAGLSFSQLAFGAAPGLSLGELNKLGAYQRWVKRIESEILASQRWDKRAGVGMKFSHRRFDLEWLQSPKARFHLVAVVNRYDRMPFAPQHCGELRLVYRLAYETEQEGMKIASRLPMTVNLVLWQRKAQGGACQERWKHWTSHGGPALAQLLEAGRDNIKSLEVNLQSLRWPATVHPSLGGHAEYLLMQFRPDAAKGYRAGLLENQPIYKRWSRKEQRAFRAWLAEPAQLASLREGTIQIPESYLAKAAISAAPHALARGINRPFAKLMPPELYVDFPFEGLAPITNYKELERRLDTMSCSGCHQSKSLAGFHLLGKDASDKVVDALATPYSPHLLDELEIRRRAFSKAMRSGEATRARNNPQRSYRLDPGGWGDHCSLGKTHASWTCKAGLSCVPTADPDLGHCQSLGEAKVGESCEHAYITPRVRPSDERAKGLASRACQEGVCERTRVGFPGGMCATSCEPARPNMRCGAIALLTNFNQCLAKRKPFAQCIVENSRPAGLRRCDTANPCRDDMICARVDQSEVGACIPPYFLFQLRVDGHPSAR